jgi:hypothetical protein
MSAPPTKRESLLALARGDYALRGAALVEVLEGYERDLKFYATRPTVAEWQDKLAEVAALQSRLDAAEARATTLEHELRTRGGGA